VLTLSLRLAPVIASLPGGEGFLRRKMVAGIRENAGHCEWFDGEAQRAYVEPVLAGIGRVVALARRLGSSEEPERLSTVVARVRVPIIVFVGLAPHPSSPGAEELTALEPLGARLTIVRLPGVGHFPHEEATDVVAARLLGRSEHAMTARVAR
jgi:pimeloyl-ACP methyl ester carboxylesterase